MTTGGKQAGALGMLGFVFATTGAVFLGTGNAPLGSAMLGVGLGFFIGAAVRRSRSTRAAAPPLRTAGGVAPAEVGAAPNRSEL